MRLLMQAGSGESFITDFAFVQCDIDSLLIKKAVFEHARETDHTIDEIYFWDTNLCCEFLANAGDYIDDYIDVEESIPDEIRKDLEDHGYVEAPDGLRGSPLRTDMNRIVVRERGMYYTARAKYGDEILETTLLTWEALKEEA